MCVKIRAYSYPTTSLPPSKVYGGSSRLRGAGPFLMRPEVTSRWSWTSGYLPLAPNALDDAGLRDYLEREPRWRIPVAQMLDTVITARWPGNRVVEIQIVLENMVQALMQGSGPASTLVPRAEAEITRLIAESR